MLNKLSIAIIIIQFVLLALFVSLSLSLGIGWYVSYLSWQEYVQPREQVFYDGLFYLCVLMGSTNERCQLFVEGAYTLDAFEGRYLLGSQDWVATQGKEAGEVR